MLETDNFHSRLVGWSKILLPLGALGLLSTLFLFARESGSPPEIPFSDVAALAADQRISAPRFSGMTENGAMVTISAHSAKPNINKADTFAIEDVSMRMDTPNGTRIDVTAIHGELNSSAKTAYFTGLTLLETSNGYQMETNGLTSELDTGIVMTDGIIEVHAPYGELTGGRFTARLSKDNTGQHMLFTEGVHLIYVPQK